MEPDSPVTSIETGRITKPRQGRFAGVIPGWDTSELRDAAHVIGVLPGEGVGPEVIDASLDVLEAVRDCTSLRFDIRTGGKIGLPAQRETGQVLTPETENFCRSVFDQNGAVFCGPGGGRFVYELRARFDLFCKMTPIQPIPALRDTGVLRPEAVADVDIMVIRENVGGLYLGEFGDEIRDDTRRAYHRFHYDEFQVRRILGVGLDVARLRHGRLCVIHKPGGTPSISRLWQEQLENLGTGSDVEVRTLEVDTAVYQLIADARSFDVVVAPNMFGDVVGDGAATLLGSRGMSYSANFADDRVAVYQTAHGAAHDLAGSDRANPLGQIQSLAMMLNESFGLGDVSTIIRAAINDVLGAGWRTPDILASGCREIGTRELGNRVADAVRRRLSEPAAGTRPRAASIQAP